MAEQFVCKAAEFKDGDRRIVRIGQHEIGVFKHKGEIFAYSNYCLHQGGPACEGLTIAARRGASQRRQDLEGPVLLRDAT